MSDGVALLLAVLEVPSDDLARLACADWLDEQGDTARAQLIRYQVQLGRIGHRPASCGDRSCPCARLSLMVHELYRAGDPRNASVWAGEPLKAIASARYRFIRGFVGYLSLRAADFRRHARSVFSRHPVVEVTLVGRRPVQRDGLHWWLAARGEVSCESDHAAVPAPVFALLGPDRVEGYAGEEPLLAGYEDRNDALADLSRACVAWGRRMAGLRPLEGVRGAAP